MQKHGFYIHHQSGSHINLRHESNKMLHVVIPYHNRDLAPKTLQSILLQADLTIEDILK
jgi:predicted RNA binding protein YcfA (HicA-like mRNA interferase family)